jgi:predicted DsbA family dithiol-disulfide isomerase
MGQAAMTKLKESRDVAVEFRAYELRPAGAPAMPPAQEAAFRQKVQESWPRVQQIALNRFGLDLRRSEDGTVRPTRMAHMGAKYALAHGQGEAYHAAVFKAHWQEVRDIADPDVLTAIARDLGLDEAEFRAALTDPALEEEVVADEAWAEANGLNGVPAFIFGERYLVSGAQPLTALEQAVDRCLAEGLTA